MGTKLQISLQFITFKEYTKSSNVFYALFNISIKYKKSEGMHLYHFYSSLVS